MTWGLAFILLHLWASLPSGIALRVYCSWQLAFSKVWLFFQHWRTESESLVIILVAKALASWRELWDGARSSCGVWQVRWSQDGTGWNETHPSRGLFIVFLVYRVSKDLRALLPTPCTFYPYINLVRLVRERDCPFIFSSRNTIYCKNCMQINCITSWFSNCGSGTPQWVMTWFLVGHNTDKAD